MLIRFTQKLMLVFAFRPPIRVPNFSKIEARTLQLWRFLQSVRNDEEEKKNEEILGNGLRDFIKI